MKAATTSAAPTTSRLILCPRLCCLLEQKVQGWALGFVDQIRAPACRQRSDGHRAIEEVETPAGAAGPGVSRRTCRGLFNQIVAMSVSAGTRKYRPRVIRDGTWEEGAANSAGVAGVIRSSDEMEACEMPKAEPSQVREVQLDDDCDKDELVVVDHS